MSDPRQPLSLEGRRYLVTGASSGIGLATCQLVSRLGGRVLAWDINADGLKTALAGLDGTGHVAFPCDLREIERVSPWMVEAAGADGLLSGAVHAAGISCIQPARLLDPARYREALLLNTEAALAVARGLQNKKVIAPEGGSLVLLSSVMAMTGSPGAAGYGMTKAALIGMAKSLAVELAPRRIRVNCVAPGFVKTPMFDRVSVLWDADQRARLEADHPLGLGEPTDVANAIAFLLADTARWITGSVLVVDGGYTAR